MTSINYYIRCPPSSRGWQQSDAEADADQGRKLHTAASRAAPDCPRCGIVTDRKWPPDTSPMIILPIMRSVKWKRPSSSRRLSPDRAAVRTVVSMSLAYRGEPKAPPDSARSGRPRLPSLGESSDPSGTPSRSSSRPAAVGLARPFDQASSWHRASSSDQGSPERSRAPRDAASVQRADHRRSDGRSSRRRRAARAAVDLLPAMPSRSSSSRAWAPRRRQLSATMRRSIAA